MTAATYLGVFNCLMCNCSTQKTQFPETSVVIWLKRSTSGFLDNHIFPVRSICAKQTNIFFLISFLRNNPLLGGTCVLFAILSLLQQPPDDVAKNPPSNSSLCSSLLVFAALSSKAPKTMKYCAHLIESSSHNVQLAISQTYVIPLFKLAV